MEQIKYRYKLNYTNTGIITCLIHQAHTIPKKSIMKTSKYPWPPGLVYLKLVGKGGGKRQNMQGIIRKIIFLFTV